MAQTRHSPTTVHGNRTLPGALDELASSTPDRLYAAIPKDRDLENGFLDVSCADMARCANFMAHWIVDRCGKSEDFETVAYIGIPDLRSAAVFIGAVKAGYKVLLPSPRNPLSTNLSLIEQTGCNKILHVVEVAPVVKQLTNSRSGLISCMEIPSFQEMLESNPTPFTFSREFEEVQNEPIVVLHSSGSTGIPKPITMTHASFAVLDRERNLPSVPGRRNRDYSIWDFNGGGRFYTVFPYFHLAGFLSLLVNPIFTESSSPVLGPPLLPPSGALLKEVMRHQKLRALYLPPSIAEQLLQEPGGLEFFKGLDFLCYTGAPFSPSAGEQLAAVTELCPLYGSTEAFQVPQLAPAHADDWAWMEWNPNFQLEMQLDNSGAYELVLFANSSTEKMSALNHNMPGVSEYRTKDLFKQHPTKPGLWQYYGRRDDIIVLSNGEKFNPVPMELKIQSHPSLSGALIVGQGRPRATLLVEPKSDVTELKKRELPDEIWPLVEETNRLLPAQGRILRGNLLLATPERPFVRAGKGTVVRKLTEQLYKEDLDVLYADDIPSSTARMLKLEGILKSPFETSAVKKFIRDILQALFPELAEIGDDEDLFSAGLDSVMIGQMLDHMKKGVQDSVPRNDLTWLDTRTVYRNSSIRRLAQVLSQFLNSGQRPDETVKNNRTAAMTALVQKYTAEFSSGSLMSMPAGNKTSRRVVLVGSTGYLGPQILRELLANADIESIYCLNRGRDAADRTANAMELSGQEPEILKRVKFISTDLNSVDLGLSATDIQLLSSTSDTIIYNAWKPDFSLPLSSFEKPFLPGLRAIIDIARASANVPRIVFISSIAAVGNWSHVFPVQPRIPEARVTDPNVALHMGYGESKWIAEQILQIAHDTCGIPVSIVRFGQVGGSSPPVKYAWPAQGWLLAIIRASKAMGAFPTHVAPVDWIPIDILAKQIVGVVEDKPKDRGYQVFNLVHSEVAPWDVFLNTLIKHFNIAGVKISLPEWLNKLEEAAQTNPDAKEYVALKFADFLRSMGDGREDMTCVSDNISKLAPIQMPPLTEELLVGWLQDWEF